MMALVPTSNSSNGGNPSTEKVCDMLQEIRDEFRTLKTFVSKQQQEKNADMNNLSEMLARAEHSVKEKTDDVLNMLNGNTIATLPFNQVQNVYQQSQGGLMSDQYQYVRDDSAGVSRGRLHVNSAVGPSRQRYAESVPIISIGAQQHRPVAPGAVARQAYESKIIRNPFNKRNRQLLHDSYGIQLPLIEKQQQQQRTPISRNVLPHKTTEPAGILPYKSRRNPIDYPVPLTAEDAKRGIISLVERGIIPQGAHITLDPPALQPKKSNLNDPSARTRTFIREDTNAFVYHLKPSNGQQLAITDKTVSPPPLPEHMSSGLLTEPSEHDGNLIASSSKFNVLTLIESRKSSANRMQKGALTTTITNNGNLNDIVGRSLSTPVSNADGKKTGRLIIQNGLTKDQTEDFLRFRQLYCLMWGNIVTVFRMLEKIMYDYAIPVAFINGERVVELAQTIELEHKPTSEELLSAVINREEVEELVKRIGRRFVGSGGTERAAVAIQSYWRRFRDRRAYIRLRKRKWAAGVIALSWLMNVKLAKARKQLIIIRRRHIELFKTKQNELKQRWSSISTGRRVIVHIPSLGLPHRIRKKLNNLPIRENFQIGRLCELDDPNVDIIYVSPISVNEEFLQYYNKLINLRSTIQQNGQQTSPVATAADYACDRYMIVVPEALHSFPTHNMCLSTLLKYSPKALKRIRNLIKGREAYIVTGITHMDDLYVSEFLNIPILGCEPEVSDLYSTKSGSKRIFEISKVPMPFGEYDIYNQQHLLEALTQLVIEHLDIQRWLFKIDDDFDGFGIAYCDVVAHLPSYKNVLKEAARFGDKWSQKWAQEHSYAKVLSELPAVLDKYAVCVNKSQYHNWQAYSKVFLAQGGIIEAYPPSDSVTSITVCLSIEPNGQHSIICSGDHLHAESQFSCWGLSFPQTSVEPNDLNIYCAQIAEQCKQRNIYGYVDVDFVTFIDAKSDKQQLWAVDLSIGYSEHVSLYRLMRFVTTGQFDPQTHAFTVQVKQTKQRMRNWQTEAPEQTIVAKNRYAVWTSRLYHSNLPVLQLSVFFQMCRAHGVGFDIREKHGSVFALLESERHENIGMVAVGETLQGTLSNFAYNLNSINQEITTTQMQGRSNFMLAINDIENILGITQENASNVSSTVTGTSRTTATS